jgi:hypothetical protein
MKFYFVNLPLEVLDFCSESVSLGVQFSLTLLDALERLFYFGYFSLDKSGFVSLVLDILLGLLKILSSGTTEDEGIW